MCSERRQIIDSLVDEVKLMPVHEQRRLQQLWRSRYGYESAVASLEDMARELALERSLILW